MSAIKIFEDRKVRSHYDSNNETWYFSIIDIIEILTDQPHYQGARNYWKVLKSRLLKEGNETVTNCNRLKFVAEEAKGLIENAKVSKKSGAVAKNARIELEQTTGKSIVTGENFLPPKKDKKLK